MHNFFMNNNHIIVFYILIFFYPSVGSCHHGMERTLRYGWGSRPPDMEVSCEYIE